MSKVRLSASVDADLVAAAEAAVARGQLESVSAWVNDALRAKAEHDRRLEALGEFLAAYEREHGEITPEEMRTAARPRARPRGTARRKRPGAARPSARGSGR
jgi:hypothetical protein